MNRSKFLDPRADSGRTLPNIGSNSSLLCGADKCRPNLEVWKDIQPLIMVSWPNTVPVGHYDNGSVVQ